METSSIPILIAMRTRNRTRRIAPLLFLLFSSFIPAQEVREATEADFGDFLRLQADTEAVRELFSDYMSRERNITEVVTLLEEILPLMDNSPSKQFLLGESAVLHDLLGRLEKAQSLYERAALFFPERILHEKLLRSAEILFETGSYARASSQARAILAGAAEDEIRLAAETLLLEIEACSGSREETKRKLLRLLRTAPDVRSASLLYRWYRAAVTLELAAEAERLEKLVIGGFPGSPEAAILTGEGPYAEGVKPSDYLLPELLEKGVPQETSSSETAAIQTGFFRNRKNAAQMRDRLIEKGFTAEIHEKSMEEEIFYSVLVPDIPLSRSQATVLALKEEGFDGFLVFGE